MEKLMPNFQRVLEVADIRGYRKGHATLTMSREGFHRLIRELLSRFEFDEEFYLSRNPDVAKGIESGAIESAFDHYVHFGYYEGRLPHMSGFVPAEYVQSVPELMYLQERDQEEIKAVAENHFQTKGYADGRENG